MNFSKKKKKKKIVEKKANKEKTDAYAAFQRQQAQEILQRKLPKI